MAFKKNKVKVDLRSYPPYLIMGERKVGKTSLVYELAKLNYSLDEMLLISMGDEKGFHSLDGIQYEECFKWNKIARNENDDRGFVQIVKDLVENNKEYGFKMVVIDTLDTLIDVGIEEVLYQHKAEKGTVCKSLNDAFGGYNRGRDRLVDMLKKQINLLDGLGVAVFILAHTKNKDKTDPLTGEKYEMLTNNLRGDFYSPIADSCQMIVNIAIERQIEEGIQVGEKRMMYFRNNGLVDAGCRFNDVPDKLELSAENFMKAFEQGVKSSMNSNSNIEQAKKEEEQAIERNIEKAQEAVKEIEKEEQIVQEQQEESTKEQLLVELKKAISNTEKKLNIMEYMKSNGITKIGESTTEQIKEMLNL